MSKLQSPPIGDETWALADWFEFQALCSEFGLCRINQLIRINDEVQDCEDVDFTVQDSENEQLLEQTLQEIDLRSRSLNSSYPFQLNNSELHVSSEISDGGYAYLCCLFISHVTGSTVLHLTPDITNEDRDLFQICATIAAAGKVSGNAVSFGHPRPHISNFLVALKQTYGGMGEGTVHESIPPGAPTRTKDAGIDVIAWSNTPDSAPGRDYLLGQVASGNNWKGKSVINDVQVFHRTWFIQDPASTPNPAMFIPFCIDLKQSTNSSAQDTLRDVLHHLTITFGNVIYRYRLPDLVSRGMLLKSSDPGLIIERYDEFYRVRGFVDGFRSQLLN